MSFEISAGDLDGIAATIGYGCNVVVIKVEGGMILRASVDTTWSVFRFEQMYSDMELLQLHDPNVIWHSFADKAKERLGAYLAGTNLTGWQEYAKD